jgi:glycosyltransferase involved in cell wall biosynthesis
MMSDDPIPTDERPAYPSILYVATVGSTIHQFLRPYATHFRSLGWRVDAVANQADIDPTLLEAFDHVYGSPLSRSLLDVMGMIAATRSIARLLAAGRYDIVHVHTPIAGFVTRIAVRRMPRKRRPAVVYTAHGFHFHVGGHPITNALFRTAERVAGRWTDRLIVMNEEDHTAARRARIVPAAHLYRLPGIGIDLDRYSRAAVTPAEAEAARGPLGSAPGSPLIVSIGELSVRKRPWDVVTALTMMRHGDATLVFVGDGPERPRVLAAIEGAGLADRVRLTGHVDDVRPLLGAASVLVLASSREGLPRSIMEALAMEVPVVASSARGNAELVDDSGFIVPIGDPRALADAVDVILDGPDEALAMGRRGRARMLQKYDLAILLNLHESIYRDALAMSQRLRNDPGPSQL